MIEKEVNGLDDRLQSEAFDPIWRCGNSDGHNRLFVFYQDGQRICTSSLADNVENPVPRRGTLHVSESKTQRCSEVLETSVGKAANPKV